MTITREDVADLQPGDVVELADERYPGVLTTGPLRDDAGELLLGGFTVRAFDGLPAHPGSRTLTVVSRAPRLYVNHPRTEPVARDVAVADGGKVPYTYVHDGVVWRDQYGHQWGLSLARLRLLVDGETGQVVP